MKKGFQIFLIAFLSLPTLLLAVYLVSLGGSWLAQEYGVWAVLAAAWAGICAVSAALTVAITGHGTGPR